MKQRWIYDSKGYTISVGEDYQPEPMAGCYIMPDIKPYKSMIDGSQITSRSKHREHLKANGCIEVGNEVKHLKPFGDYSPPPGRKEMLIELANQKLRRK